MADLRHSSLWYDSNGFVKDVSFAEGKAWPNFTDNTLVKFGAVNGVCLWLEALIVEENKQWLPNDYAPTARYFNSDCGAAPLEPEYDLDGTIQLNLDGSIELVQPE